MKELQALGVIATLYRKVHPERRRTNVEVGQNKKENQQFAYRLSLTFLTERPAGPHPGCGDLPVLPRASKLPMSLFPIGVFASSFPGHAWCRNPSRSEGRGPWLLKDEASEPLGLTLLAFLLVCEFYSVHACRRITGYLGELWHMFSPVPMLSHLRGLRLW
jgi:hypothetical protein